MRDVLAAIIIFFIIVIAIIVTSDKPPTDKFDKMICANITCYYEIKDK